MGIDRRLIQNFDWGLLILVLLLGSLGIVNLISAAPGSAESWLPYTAKRQMIWFAVGSVAMFAMVLIDYRRLERLSLLFYLGCVALLVAVLFLAPIINGSQRWIVLGPARLQPSEITKLAMILLFARMLQKTSATEELGFRQLALPALAIAIPCALVLRQPDLGTALSIALVAGSFAVVARIRLSTVLSLGVAGATGAGLAWFFCLHDYQKQRLLTFLDPERDPLGAAYHAIQSQIAIGSGGLFGRGFLQGPQSQLDFLPEQQTDFVFSVLGEEWGFVGAGVVLCLYAALMLRGLMIARASKDAFGSYLAVGVVGLFFWAGAINVGMVLGLLPVVGVPLPFLSHGGSSLLTAMLACGLLLSVSMRRYVF